MTKIEFNNKERQHFDVNKSFKMKIRLFSYVYDRLKMSNAK